MAHATQPRHGTWTAADLVERFGAIPLCRVRHDPAPGMATEHDLRKLLTQDDRLYELVDGVLVEKTVGTYESYLALLLGRLLGNHVEARNLGVVLGADGMLRLAPGLIRAPDISFISWDRLPDRCLPAGPVAELVPHLAVEVISKYNTPEEMDRKLVDYFAAGVRLVWYIYHTPERIVRVYRSPQQCVGLGERDVLDGGDVVPGFQLAVGRIYAGPGPTP